MSNLCSVRALVGLLWNLVWIEAGRVFDMDRGRAEELSKTKPKPSEVPEGTELPAGYVEILGEPTGAVIEPAPIQRGPTELIREEPLPPVSLFPDSLEGCPAAAKLAALSVTTKQQLRGFLTAHGDNFAKVMQLTKAEASAVVAWADTNCPAPAVEQPTA